MKQAILKNKHLMEKMVEFLKLSYFVNKYSRKGIIIDTEPLLILIAGRCDLSQLSKVGKYNEKDYEGHR